MATAPTFEAFDVADRPALIVLSLFDDPVSVDDLVRWNVVPPVQLWRLLEEARKREVILESAPGAGRFRWSGKSDRGALWAAASVPEWQSALVHPAIIERAQVAVRQAVEARNRAAAAALFSGLVNVQDPERFPGGRRDFLRVACESCQRFVHAEWRTLESIDRAIGIAEETANRAALGLLLGVRANTLLYAGALEEAEAAMVQSRDIAASLDVPEFLKQASIGLALIRTLAGEFRSGIEAFERLLGNVPGEILPAVEQMFTDDGLIVLETIGTIALAYQVVGEPTRAVDLLHRAEALGVRQERRDVVHLARLYLGLIRGASGDIEHARAHAQSVLDYWLDEGNRPFFAWFAAINLALVHRADANAERVRAALKIGHDARVKANFPYFFSGELLDLLEWLEGRETQPIDGLTLATEIPRNLAWINIRMKGIARHVEARRLLSRDADSDVGERLAEAEGLLRRSGAVLDLAAVLETTAAWHEHHGRPDRSAECRREAHDLRRSVPPIVPTGGAGVAPTESKAFHLIELGRLLVRGDEPADWGDVAARLCSHFAAERAVIVEATDPPRLLAARGGGAAWAAAALAVAGASSRDAAAFVNPPVTAEEPNGTGQFIVVPFACRRIQRFGWIGLENRHTRPMFGPEDCALLAVLSSQVSVLLENAALWHELQAARERLEHENRYYRDEERRPANGSCIVGHSEALQQTLNLTAKIAGTDTAVLITGETGVGKELVAREIHALSPRRGGPFIVVHIASLTPGLVASGLFGHERGAFTGATDRVIGRIELSHGGTLFLDEIGELGPEEQVRLLRVLQDGVFERVGGTRALRSDFRLVAATNRDLAAEVAAGRFRADLFYRLNVFPIHVPPLRRRKEDIPTLALFFMEQAARRLGRSFDGIGEADMARLVSYPWPGNVRELMHTIERAAVLSDGPRLRIPPLEAREVPPGVAVQPRLTTLAEAERGHIRQVLEHTGGRVTGAGGAADILGLKPSTLNFRIRKLGLTEPLRQVRSTRSHRRRPK